MSGPLPPGLLNAIREAARQGGTYAATGTRVKLERGVSTSDQLMKIEGALEAPIGQTVGSYNGHWSFVVPTAAFQTTAQTIGLWHCNENTGTQAADSSANDNDLTLANCTWATGKFSYGLTFNGTTSVASATLSSVEPVRQFLYFAAWIKPTSGPLFQWEDVLEVYIDGSGNLCAQVEATTYTGPPVTVGSWQLAHVQFYAGTVFIGVGDIIWSFTHGDDTLTVPAWAVTFGKRDSTYYSGSMDEMRLVADVIVQEDWGRREYNAHPLALLYCTFDLGSGTQEYHQDFAGPTVTIAGPSWQTGYLGKCLRFDGSDDYASFTPTAAVTGTAFSIELVLKWNTVAACTLVDQTSGINLAFDGTNWQAALQGVTNPSSNLAAWTPTAATWYTVTLVWDGTTKALWVNGQKRGEVAATGTLSIPASLIYLGRTVAGAGYLAGDLDFLHIARVALRPQKRPIPRFVIEKSGFEAHDDWVLLD